MITGLNNMRAMNIIEVIWLLNINKRNTSRLNGQGATAACWFWPFILSTNERINY